MPCPHTILAAPPLGLALRFSQTILAGLVSLYMAFASPAAIAGNFVIDTGRAAMGGQWWNPDEPGWGLSLTQNGANIVAAWFAYDGWGTPVWYLMPACAVTDNACNGEIYRMDGGTRLTLPWNGQGLVVRKIGDGMLSFSDANTGTFDFGIDGTAGQKNIVRQAFSTTSPAPTVDYSALWGISGESGWGVAINQQGSTINAALLTYVAGGSPVWYLAPDCSVSGGYCSSTLYRTSGGSTPTAPWSGTVALTPAGTLELEFLGPDSATMRYLIDGQFGARSIGKNLFYPAGQLLPGADTLARQCANPRPDSVLDPSTGRSYGDLPGSLDQEKGWIRSFVNETYLWYKEVPLVDPALYAIGASVRYTDPKTNNARTTTLVSDAGVVDAYFNSQRTPAFTASGRPKDQFHFTYATGDWNALSTGGKVGGFGFEVALLASSPPRQALVAYTTPDTPAALNDVRRGAQILSVNGVDVANGSDIDTLNEGMFAPIVGKTYSFALLDAGSPTPRTVVMTAADVALSPVLNVRTLPAPNEGIGYILFTDHIAPAESQLIAAVNQLKAANNGAGISDLVLDLRYNGGGYLDIASELAYMIAGGANTEGKAFEQLGFNDKNPFHMTAAESVTPFHAVSQGFSVAPGQPLPQLGLNRVYVLTGGATCSASESIINGLRGAGVTVIQVGATTCGKPYGFIPRDNCNTTYFAIQFKGINHLGFGDYADGFVPGGTSTAGNNVPGCEASDDFSMPLGDPGESRLATALYYRATGTCPATTRAGVLGDERTGEPVLQRSAMRENRFVRPR